MGLVVVRVTTNDEVEVMEVVRDSGAYGDDSQSDRGSVAGVRHAPEALRELRISLLGSLRGGQDPHAIGLRDLAGEPAGGAEDEIRELGDQPLPATTSRLRRRTTAVPAADPRIGGPSWAVGQTPARGFGPFRDRGGRLHWFDVFEPGGWFRLVVQGDPEPVAMLPAGTVVRAGVVQVPAGSVWLRAQRLGARMPAGTWVGLHIDGATGTPSGSVQAAPGGVVLRLGGSIRLALTLAVGELADFPATASVTVAASGTQIEGLAAGSATAFGTTVSFPAATGAVALDGVLRAVVLPLAPEPDRFTAVDAMLSGEAAIRGASWALPLTDGPAAILAEAEAPGWIAIQLDPGVEAALPGIEGGPIALGASYVLASTPGARALAPAASNPRMTQTLAAWFEDRVERRSAFELTWPAAFACWLFRAAGGAEAVVTHGDLALHIDRPLRASGERLGSRIAVTHLVERDADGARLTAIGAQAVDSSRRFALALSNALFTVAEPGALELFASLRTPVELDSGAVVLRLPLFQLVPALPDPYAASFDLRVVDHPDPDVSLRASVIWTEPFAAQLDLALDPPPFTMFSTRAVVPEERAFRGLDPLTDRFSAFVPQIVERGLTLVDVSSQAAQVGVVLGYNDRPHGGLAIRDLALNIHGGNATAFLLPQFQWEPVYNVFNPNVLGDAPGWRGSTTDGGPTQIAADMVRLVPVRPLQLLDDIVASYRDEQRRTALLFTLPFGIRALAQLDPVDPGFTVPPRLEITSPRFAGLDGAPQLTLTAGTQPDGQPFIHGQSTSVSPPDPSLLGVVIGGEFDKAFADRVPLERIALSGYGASLFSRWVIDADVGITQVAFDAFNGRTAYERILMTTWLLPCFARMVRTVTFERRGGGAVVRWDSGWIATTPGLFQHKDHISHKCVIQGLHNIREVRDTDHIVTVDGVPLQAVYFDADAGMDNLVRGGDSAGRVPVRRHLGFIQLLKIPVPPPEGPVQPVKEPPISAGTLCKLLDQEAPIGGPIDCEIRIADSPHTMKVTSIVAANIDGAQFSVAPCGMPSLAGPGQWSVVKVDNASGAVEPVAGPRGIPLTRLGGGPFRFAEAADLVKPNPASDYAFLFSSGAQRVLFPRPQVETGATAITSVVPPRLADPYALLRGTGLFPPLAQSIPFSLPNWGLESVAGALRLDPFPHAITASVPDFDLLKTSEWATRFHYSSWDPPNLPVPTEFTIGPDWTIRADALRQSLSFPVVGEVMQIIHGIEAPAVGADQFPEPGVVFSDALAAVTDVLRALRDWAPDLPSPLRVDASFSGSTFRLSALASFNLEDEDGNAIDCGMGKLKGNLELGAELSVEVFQRTTHGAVFFEITGSWQQQIFPLLYGGGLLRFKVRADNDGRTTLELDACVTGSVGGDLIPGLVSVEATVKYGYFLFTSPIMPGFLAGIEGRAKLLSGLLGFKFGVEGRIGVTRTTKNLADPQHLCKLHGEILVSGTVTVAWLIEERKSFRTQFDVDVDWKMALLAAKAALLPIP